MQVDDQRLRRLAALLGLGAAAFGIPPVVAPGFFCRLFGIEVRRQPTIEAVCRSIGVRDVVLGLGLWSAAVHDDRMAPWLLARALTDSGDAVATFIAIGQGERRPRFIGLSMLALGASIYGAVLWLAAQRSKSARVP